MATPAQIEANLANAKQSTGPRTPEGKARSSLNNLRDGFRSQSVVLPGDDPAAYQTLLDELTGHFDPADLTDRRCIREMTDAEWRLRRTRRQIEERYWEEFANIRTQFPGLSETKLDLRTFESLHQPGAVYPRFLTFEAKYERQYDRAYRTWVDYQKGKTTGESRALDLALKRVKAGLPPFDPPDSNRTNEPNSPALAPAGDNEAHQPPVSPQLVEPGVSPIPQRLDPFSEEDNPAPVSAQNGTFEPNPAPVSSAQPETPRAEKQGTPRNAPCPCRSGLKFKRCCGRSAPPVLFRGAQAA